MSAFFFGPGKQQTVEDDKAGLDEDSIHKLAILTSGKEGLILCDGLATRERRKECRVDVHLTTLRRRTKKDIDSDLKNNESVYKALDDKNEAEAEELTAREKGIRHAQRYVYYYSEITEGTVRLLGMAISRDCDIFVTSATVRTDKYTPVNDAPPVAGLLNIAWEMRPPAQVAQLDWYPNQLHGLVFDVDDMTEVVTEVAKSVDDAIDFMEKRATFKFHMVDAMEVSFASSLASSLGVKHMA